MLTRPDAFINSIDQVNLQTPLYYFELLILLGRLYVSEKNNFSETNLSGCEGKNIFELPARILEKLILYHAGFSRNEKYVSEKELVVEDLSKDKLHDEIHKIVLYFFEQNCNVSVRVHKNDNSNDPIQNKVIWLTKSDGNFIKKNNLGEIVLISTDGQEYVVQKDDVLHFYSSAISICRPMKIDEERKEKNINMGGGFTCKLKSFNPRSNIFTLHFNFITNNGNPRHIGSRREEYPEFELNIDVKVKNGEFIVVNGGNDPSLEEVISNQDMIAVLRKVASNIIAGESRALLRIFNIALTLYPKLDFHLLKGFYAIEEPNLSSWLIFDFESAEQGEKWRNKANDNHAHAARIKDPEQELIKYLYDKYHVQYFELDPAEQLLFSQLKILRMSCDVDEIKQNIMVDFEARITTFLNYLSEYLLQETLDELKNLIESEAKKIIDSFNGVEHRNNSIELILGKLAWMSLNSCFVEKESGLYVYQLNNQVQIIVLDLGDYKMGFVIKNGKLMKTLASNNGRETNIKEARKMLAEVGVQTVKAANEYL